jgi:DNA-binding MarR family transcriptional regulator
MGNRVMPRGSRSNNTRLERWVDAPPLPDGLDIGYALAKLARMIARHNAVQINALLGLTLAEWRVLLVLGDREQMQFNAVAELALLEKSHASTASRNLQENGLIRQAVDSTDRRRMLVARTKAGGRLVTRYLKATAADARSFWGVLSASEKQALRDSLRKLLDAAGDQDRRRIG